MTSALIKQIPYVHVSFLREMKERTARKEKMKTLTSETIVLNGERYQLAVSLGLRSQSRFYTWDVELWLPRKALCSWSMKLNSEIPFKVLSVFIEHKYSTVNSPRPLINAINVQFIVLSALD